jgi:hypothetical protein
MVRHPYGLHDPLWISASEDVSWHNDQQLMQRPIPWFWIVALAVLLLAPGFAARLFVDVLEGVTLLLVFGPLPVDHMPQLRHTKPGCRPLPGLWHPTLRRLPDSAQRSC